MRDHDKDKKLYIFFLFPFLAIFGLVYYAPSCFAPQTRLLLHLLVALYAFHLLPKRRDLPQSGCDFSVLVTHRRTFCNAET